MSLFFILNNIHLAVSLIGALAFFMMAWLSFDSFNIRHSASTLVKAVALSLLALVQVADSFTGFTLKTVGLPYNIFVGLVSIGVVLWAYRKLRAEQNKTLKPLIFGFSFLFLAKSALVSSSFLLGGNTLLLVLLTLEFIGFIFLFWWVWQYLALRIQEEMMLIFAGMALLVASVVTVAFSGILVSQVSNNALENLTTSVRVMDLAITNRESEALAKVRLLASDGVLPEMITDRQIGMLDVSLSKNLEAEELDFLIVLDELGEVVKSVPVSGRAGSNLRQTVFGSRSLLGESLVTIDGVEGSPWAIVASAPIIEDDIVVGVVVGGFFLDNGFVDNLEKITGLEASVYRGAERVATTEVGVDGRTRLNNITEVNDQVVQQVLEQNSGIALHTTINSEPYLASYLPIHDTDNKTVGMISATQSGRDVVDLATKTNQLTFIIVVVLMLLIMTPAYFVTRKIAF